jgi:hypothetical protein
MKKLCMIVGSFAALTALRLSTLGATEYVVVNNNNPIANSVTLYRLNQKTVETLVSANDVLCGIVQVHGRERNEKTGCSS